MPSTLCSEFMKKREIKKEKLSYSNVEINDNDYYFYPPSRESGVEKNDLTKPKRKQIHPVTQVEIC